ncbi:MAG: PLP-dependent transferase [Oscillospiraceae bacterium]
MKTPIFDFVSAYAESAAARFHMPGHKGQASALGVEARDITEIAGADNLFAPDGIIAASENHAAQLFGCAKTLFSTEGSSLCIRTMVALAVMNAPRNQRPVIIAPRNVHRSFISACILSDAEVRWVYSLRAGGIAACDVTAAQIDAELSACPVKPAAVYVTSPDYYGNIADIPAIAAVCARYGVPFLVDNAHGAYLKFTKINLHPMALGADVCADSAHKTLPVLTGGAYLHIAEKASRTFSENAKDVMALFASTSPSYLTLQSLDLCNRALAGDFPSKIRLCADKLAQLKSALSEMGRINFVGSEPLKLTIVPQSLGLTGAQLGERLRTHGIEPELADDDAVVLMVGPYNSDDQVARFAECIKKAEMEHENRTVRDFSGQVALQTSLPPRQAMTLREAQFAPREQIAADQALGRICASVVSCCTPAVPIVVGGEIIDEIAMKFFEKYSISVVNVVK